MELEAKAASKQQSKVANRGRLNSLQPLSQPRAHSPSKRVQISQSSDPAPAAGPAITKKDWPSTKVTGKVAVVSASVSEAPTMSITVAKSQHRSLSGDEDSDSSTLNEDEDLERRATAGNFRRRGAICVPRSSGGISARFDYTDDPALSMEQHRDEERRTKCVFHKESLYAW
eukprot:6177171-Pleurochrysis_carterae.AAC.2